MIIFQKQKDFFSHPLDFRLINAFEESVCYDRYYKLPFNILTYRKDVDPEVSSYMENRLTGEQYPAVRKQLLFIPYGLPIFIHRQPDFHSLDIHFTLERYPGADFFCGQTEILDLSSSACTVNLEKIFEEPCPETAYCRMEALVLSLCAGILPKKEPEKVWRFAPLLQDVRKNITADWNVAMLAEKVSMSTGAFSREFSAHMHCTAKKFLQDELLRKALFLLHDPKENVQSTALKMHFSSPFYFSKFFKRLYGISPSDFRRNSFRDIS